MVVDFATGVGMAVVDACFRGRGRGVTCGSGGRGARVDCVPCGRADWERWGDCRVMAGGGVAGGTGCWCAG